MKIIENTTQFKIDCPTAVAVGKFDGIHLGHVELLNRIKEYASQNEELGMKTVVFTFDTQAATFFSSKIVKEVTTLSEKRVIFEQLGLDYLVEYPLNAVTAKISPEAFIKDILVNMLNMKYIAAGEDVSYGYKGLGDAKLLNSMSQKLGYRVEIIEKLLYEGREISSTFLREEISKGNMLLVQKLLGHPYSFAGTVEQGFKLGRKLGFPTMNLYPDEAKILPPFGVYYSNVKYEGANYPGLTNIGIRPTVASPGDRHVSVETYLFDFDKDMYNKKIVTELLDFKRAEEKFSGPDKLKEKIALDIEEGKKYFDGY